MRARIHHRPRGQPRGGIATYGVDSLLQEISYVAYHFHWPLAEILDLEHPDRRRFADEIDRINTRARGR
ncbi:DUF6760 family protein [Nocardia vinacea]|uniref:DUF6760 family protein n=1 Tax=Nocardia TaxID=1817 RepID=UPI002E15CB93